MKKLSVTNASRLAGVSRQIMYEQIKSGEISRTADGIDVGELIKAYPKLKLLASQNNNDIEEHEADINIRVDTLMSAASPAPESNSKPTPVAKTVQQAGTVELLVRELEWNKALLEQTNQLMAKQLAEQRAHIADQARRLDEKDRFWARQIEIAQSLLPAPAPIPLPRKKFLGIF